MKSDHANLRPEPWNKGKLVGQKAPFKLKEIWAIRVRLQMQQRLRELALVDLGIDGTLRTCDLVTLRDGDECHRDRVAARAIVLQQKTQRPVQFEITASTRDAIEVWVKQVGLKSDDILFSSRIQISPHLATRQYVRGVKAWVKEIGDGVAPHGARGCGFEQHEFDDRRAGAQLGLASRRGGVPAVDLKPRVQPQAWVPSHALSSTLLCIGLVAVQRKCSLMRRR